MSREDGWEGRPWAARLVKFVAFFGPLIVAVLSTIWISRQLPPPQSFGAAVGVWLLLGVVATVIVFVVDRLARRLLPFAALLQLSLAFPGEVPSRYKVARTRGGSRELQAEVDRAREHGLSDDRTDAAVTVLRLVSALSTHDRATRGHAERVRVFVDMIAEELDVEEVDIDRLRWAALLHDVGKIAVHPDVLNHPGRPSEEAWELLRTHPLEGARIVAPLRPWLGHWVLTIEQHHERWDGEGYPYGISGEELSLGARIVAVADAYDVMTAARAYKQPLPAHEAREELARHAGTQFDPDVVRAFLAIPLGRLRWAIGPFSWLVSTPFGRPFENLSGGAGAIAAAVVAALVGAAGYGLPAAAPADLPEIADVADEPSPSDDPEPSASPAPSPTPGAALVVLGEQVVADTDGTVRVNVLENDAVDGRELRLVDVTASIGDVTWTPEGDIEWIAPDGFVGTALITYVVSDGTSTEEGQLEVEVEGPVDNAAPVVVDDTGVVAEDGVVVLDLLGDDVDPDGEELDLVGLGSPARGTVRDNGDGTVTYTPDRDAVGGDRFTYNASDGTATVTGVVTVTIRAVDDAPRPFGDSATVVEDGSTTVDVLANDLEVDGEALRVVAASVPGAATSIGADGRVTVVPAADVTGVLEGYVLVTDGGTAVRSSFVVDVLPVNDAPRVTPGPTVRAAADAGLVTISGWASNISPGPANEAGQRLSVTVSVDRPGQFATLPRLDAATGTLTFRFATSASGPTSVTFVVRDDGGTARGGRDATSVTTTLTAVAGAPTANDDSATTTVDQPVVIDVLANDSDPQGRALTVIGIDDSATSLGEVVDLGDGRIRFEPNPGATGTTTFSYTMSNGSAADTATVTITIQP